MTTTHSTAATTNASTYLGPGEGKTYRVAGDTLTFKLGPEQTGGAFTLAESTVPPGGGPPPHLHAREDELFYVLEGDYHFTLDDKTVRGSRGSAVFLPKGIVHKFTNVGATPGRFLIIASPSGFERFIPEAAGCECADLSAPISPPTQADVDRLMTTCAKYGLEMRPDHKVPEPTESDRAPDRELWVLGEHVRMKLTGADTGGSFCVCEVASRPGGGVPPHSHRDVDEVFYVLEGVYEFQIGDRRVTALPGSTVHVPKGTVHGFRNVGEGPGRVVDYHSPAGFEGFLEEAGCVCTDASAGPPQTHFDPGQMAGLMRKHGMELGG